jgi:hypothetical protein
VPEGIERVVDETLDLGERPGAARPGRKLLTRPLAVENPRTPLGEQVGLETEHATNAKAIRARLASDTPSAVLSSLCRSTIELLQARL